MSEYQPKKTDPYETASRPGAEPNPSPVAGIGPDGRGCPPWQGGPREPYRWEFDDYAKADEFGESKHGSRPGGLFAFAVMLCGIFALSVTVFSTYGFWNLLSAGRESSSSQSTAYPPVPSNQVGSLNLTDKPASGASSRADAGGEMTIPDIAEQVKPSVVGVLQYLKSQPYNASGEGSGIVWSADGVIVTNAHVVRGADAISVVLENGDSYKAELIGIDNQTDLAVIKIDAEGLVAATLGDSDLMRVGETVVAIGNSGGLQLAGTVTDGIISALNRMIDNSAGETMTYIQTNAAINPGNSGGALVNLYGEIIGLNTAKVVMDNYEGIGFAMPINQVKPIVEQLLRYGKVTGRVTLGIEVEQVDATRAELNGWPTGAMIIAIKPDSDLARLGIREGDIITELNGKAVNTSGELTAAIVDLKPGDTVTLSVFRHLDGKHTTFLTETVLMEQVE